MVIFGQQNCLSEIWRVYPYVSQTAETYPAHELTTILHNLCGPSHETMHRAHHILGHTMGIVPHVETE